MVGVSAAQKHRSGLARTAVVAERQAWNAAQHVLHGLRLQTIHILTGDDRNGCQRGIGRLRGARGRHDHFVESLCISGERNRTGQRDKN